MIMKCIISVINAFERFNNKLNLCKKDIISNEHVQKYDFMNKKLIMQNKTKNEQQVPLILRYCDFNT